MIRNYSEVSLPIIPYIKLLDSMTELYNFSGANNVEFHGGSDQRKVFKEEKI